MQLIGALRELRAYLAEVARGVGELRDEPTHIGSVVWKWSKSANGTATVATLSLVLTIGLGAWSIKEASDAARDASRAAAIASTPHFDVGAVIEHGAFTGMTLRNAGQGAALHVKVFCSVSQFGNDVTWEGSMAVTGNDEIPASGGRRKLLEECVGHDRVDVRRPLIVYLRFCYESQDSQQRFNDVRTWLADPKKVGSEEAAGLPGTDAFIGATASVCPPAQHF